MDPFKEVLADAEDQLEQVNRLLREYREDHSAERLRDIELLMQELTETLHDLSQSIATAQRDPSVFGLHEGEIRDRIQQVGHINAQVSSVQEQLAQVREEGQAAQHAAESAQSAQSAQSGAYNAELDTELSPEERAQLVQQQIEDQDNVLDSVFTTVTALRQQANVMSRELEDQAVMLDDFERQADTAGDHLRQGLKRVDYVLKHNRETLSTCCITLLIIALVILLVLLVII